MLRKYDTCFLTNKYSQTFVQQPPSQEPKFVGVVDKVVVVTLCYKN
jgi:hypothetical protein